MNDLHMIEQRDLLFKHCLLQFFGHDPAGIRTDTGRSSPGIVIRLISDILAIPILRERNAQLNKPEEALNGERSLAERDISVHALSAEKGFRHFPHAVRFSSGQGELIVGLLIRPRIAAGPRQTVLRHEEYIPLSHLIQTVRCVISRSACADDGRPASDHPAVRASDSVIFFHQHSSARPFCAEAFPASLQTLSRVPCLISYFRRFSSFSF